MNREARLLLEILNASDVYFDPSPENSSLYLCFARGTEKEAADAVIDRLRSEGAWSSGTKVISEDTKPAYAEQLRFEECFAIDIPARTLLVLKADHPKYPSRHESWAAWRRILGR